MTCGILSILPTFVCFRRLDVHACSRDANARTAVAPLALITRHINHVHMTTHTHVHTHTHTYIQVRMMLIFCPIVSVCAGIGLSRVIRARMRDIRTKYTDGVLTTGRLPPGVALIMIIALVRGVMVVGHLLIVSYNDHSSGTWVDCCWVVVDYIV